MTSLIVEANVKVDPIEHRLNADCDGDEPIESRIDQNAAPSLAALKSEQLETSPAFSPPQPQPPLVSKSIKPHPTSSKSRSDPKAGMLVIAALACMAGLAVTWARKRLLRKSTSSSPKKTKTKQSSSVSSLQQIGQEKTGTNQPMVVEEEEEEESVSSPTDTFMLITHPSTPAIPTPSTPSSTVALPSSLSGLCFVASEDIDVQGLVTSYGHQQPQPEQEGHEASLKPDEEDQGVNEPSQGPATKSCSSVARLVASGALHLPGLNSKAAIQPLLGFDLLGLNYGSPLNKSRVGGGGCTGAAAMVALGQVDFALATDLLGESRVSSACQGLFCYRPTPGAVGPPSDNSSPSSASASPSPPPPPPPLPPSLSVATTRQVSIIARDPKIILKAITSSLGIQGNSDLRGEVVKFVVAQDLFDLCAPEMHPGAVAVKKAILKWAGAEQSGAVNLVKFLMANTSAWQSFPLSTSSSPPPPGGSNTETESLNLGEFLEAMIEAAEVLRIESIYSALPSNLLPPPPPPPHSSLVTASTSAAPHSNGNGPASVADAPGAEEEEESVKEVSKANGGLEEESVSQGESATIPPLTPEPGKDAEEAMKVGNTKEEVKEEKEEVGGSDSDPKLSSLPHRPSPSSLKLATKLMVEVADVLRGTVKPDTIMVMPTLPFPPPHRVKADQLEKDIFVKLVKCFCSIVTLGACPSVTCPVGQLKDGSPFSVTLFAVHKFDVRLLAVASKLTPLMQECFVELKQEILKLSSEAAAKQAPSASSTPLSTSLTKAESQKDLNTRTKSSSNKDGNLVKNTESAPFPHSSSSTSLSGSSGSGPSRNQSQVAGGAANSTVSTVDPKRAEKAEKFKLKGNEHYAAGRYTEAVSEYTRAIQMNPFVHTYYSNRAMALIKMFRFEQAEDDCTYVLERFPLTAAAAASAHAPAQDKGVGGSGLLGEKDRVKALLRRATARDALQKYDEAERDLKEVLRLEPGHRQAKEDLAMVRSQKAELDQARYNEAYASRLRGGGPPGGGAGAAAAAMMGGAGGGGVGVGLSPEERRLQMQVLSQMGLDPAAIEQMMAAEAAAGGGLGSY